MFSPVTGRLLKLDI